MDFWLCMNISSWVAALQRRQLLFIPLCASAAGANFDYSQVLFVSGLAVLPSLQAVFLGLQPQCTFMAHQVMPCGHSWHTCKPLACKTEG